MNSSASVVARLVQAVGEAQVSAAQAIEPRYLGDWMVTMTNGRPLAVIRPRTTADVSAALRICHDSGTPVVPQGGLTGLAGGATPIDSSVVISLERMSGVEEIDAAAATLTALAGTPLQAIQQAAADAGFLFPLDLGARGSAQIGGNVATNAGGNRVIRYGMTRDLVLGLEAVLADGTVVTSLNKLIKNNAGLDVRQLFVGSEGTLGIITRVVLRLFPQPRTQSVAFCALDGYDRVVAFLRHARAALGGTLSAFEMMWPDFYALVAHPASGLPAPLPAGAGAYVLVEALGASPAADAAAFEQMLTTAFEQGLIADSVVAQSAAEAKGLWSVRDAPGEFHRLLWPHVGFDIGLPIGVMGRFVEACGDALRRQWPGARTVFFGHVGDSNLHVNVKVREGEQPAADVNTLVYGLVREFGGTISAEHGIGLLKRPYLAYSRTAEEIAMMRTLKRALDPKGILNPGKVL
ncbi:MAG: FAD-binding oxidoreductase [Acidobacteria bacterium]|nr:FAD-binding oxidoreductase [Acidobacteriota bacterium]